LVKSKEKFKEKAKKLFTLYGYVTNDVAIVAAKIN
jgi:hypothetical protein